MKSSLFALACAVLGASGCVVVTHSTSGVAAGDPLNAQFYLTWATQDNATRVDIDCHSVGADMVRVTSTNTSTGDSLTDLFDCRRGAGQTYSLTAGDYSVSADLLDCAGDSSCRSPVVLSSAVPLGPIGVWFDQTIDLGHFVFLVN